MLPTTIILRALKGEPALIQTKLRALLGEAGTACRVIIDAESPPLQRFYLFEDETLAAAAKTYRSEVERWAEAMFAPLNTKGERFSLEYVWSKSALTDLMAQAPASEKLILFCLEPSVPARYRRVVEHSQCPVLILGETHWHHPPNVVVGIDPFHKSDRPADIDGKVVQKALSISKRLKGQLTLVHSCYTPSFMVKYRAMIQSTHQQVIQAFIAKHHLQRLNWHLLVGDPAEALSHYCQAHQSDLLVVGLVARGLLKRQITGSTTEQLMSERFCDLYLIP
ncbi:universal stress protein [Ferrimonas balearica]|uniref:universal stress protein n=1 Tax=Ferrimonas balearica TaxID=44012 RepID=UPI001C99229A|nr:universal stress protein [Ferrimonas balearica]MBY5922293.1 universal stress protein [Ferrimonas balearica]MBY5994367.1 universal stress protein [Ferrimonas balearica]